MEPRTLAVKVRDGGERASVNWLDRHRQYKAAKNNAKDECQSGGLITESLAEVYEKALANVLNIKPSINMEDTLFSHKNTEKPGAESMESRHFSPPERKHPYLRVNDKRIPSHTNLPGMKKNNSTTKSAFHVPEKRRQSNNNGFMRPGHANWSSEVRFSYPANYPSNDYYPVVNSAVFYSRGSPYHGAFFDRTGFYTSPRGHEYPMFGHVLPWAPFERDYKPCLSPRYREWRAKEAHKGAEKETAREGDGVAKIPQRNDVVPIETPLATSAPKKAEKTVENDGKQDLNRWRMNSSKAANNVDCNVKTRRMRASEKKRDVSKENKKTTFDSPKEEFLFCLGLTKVH